MRGSVLSLVNCMIYTGIFASAVISGTVPLVWRWPGWHIPGPLSVEQIHAIVGILLAIGSIGCTLMMTVESVPFLLYKNNQGNAMVNLKHLRDVPHETLALTQEMEEFNSMIDQDKQEDCNIFTNGNAKPLVLMILLRLMVALTSNLLINVVFLILTSGILYVDDYRLISLIIVAPRFAMSVIQVLYADRIHRKIQMIISSVLAAGTLIVIGIVLNTVRIGSSHHEWVVTVALYLLASFFQLACGIGMDQMQHVYLSEAFSTAKKRWSISFVAGIEHSFQIFMIGMHFVDGDAMSPVARLNTIIFVSGVAILLFAVVLVLALPETINMSLKQAKDSFRTTRSTLSFWNYSN